MKVEGIVLRIIRYKESSAIAHVLTDEMGRLSIMCQGMYKNKYWTKPPALETMSITNFVLRSGRNFYYLDEIESTKRMELLSRDHKAFLSAHIVAELLIRTVESDYVIKNIYPLTKTYLENIRGDNAFFLTGVWIFKYMSFLGYKPFITDKKDQLYLCREGVLTSSQLDRSVRNLPISSEDRDMIIRAINSKFNDLKTTKYDRLLELAINYAILNLDIWNLNSYDLLKKWRFYE